jgi:hypothetical protein
MTTQHHAVHRQCSPETRQGLGFYCCCCSSIRTGPVPPQLEERVSRVRVGRGPCLGLKHDCHGGPNQRKRKNDWSEKCREHGASAALQKAKAERRKKAKRPPEKHERVYSMRFVITHGHEQNEALPLLLLPLPSSPAARGRTPTIRVPSTPFRPSATSDACLLAGRPDSFAG